MHNVAKWPKIYFKVCLAILQTMHERVLHSKKKQNKKIQGTPANIYLFKVNNRNTRKGVKYVQRCQKKNIRTTSMTLFLWGFFIVNF